jgi:hypothetical protein
VRYWLPFFLAALPIGSALSADGGLQPPCGATAEPAFPPVNRDPVVAVWRESELRQADWSPAPCLAWKGTTRLAGAVAGTFTFDGGMDRLLDRIGAFSRYKLIPYWSASRRAWEPLALEAGLVGNVTPPPTRSDLQAADFVPGRAYGYFEVDRTGRTTYRLTVRERSDDRVVLATENTSPIRVAFLPLFESGALQSMIFLERGGPSLWRYYQAMRAGEGTSVLALSNASSYVNRLTAFYRYVGGQPDPRNDAMK